MNRPGPVTPAVPTTPAVPVTPAVPADDAVIAVAETHPACTVLGPGNRYVVWVQGCGINCRDCVSPQWIPVDPGRARPVAALAEIIVEQAVDGLTISGGEPFDQAPAVARLVERVRHRRDLSVLSYTGYTIEHLRRHGTAAQHRLLDSLDVLIDGPYLARAQAALRWRGSANQRVHLLTDRHAELRDAPDVSAGLQIEVAADDTVRWLGVPAVAGFRQWAERRFGLTRSGPGAGPDPRTDLHLHRDQERSR